MATTTKTITKAPDYIRTVGRRKTAVARVRLFEGQGDNLINDMSVSEYFPGETFESIFLSPFQAVNGVGKYYVTIKVEGGGKNAQAEAVAHGIARALTALDENNKPALKKRGLTTRDSRMKERRKAGNAQAARAKKSSPKR